LLDRLQEKGFDLHFESHAAAILEVDFPQALIDLESVLTNVAVPVDEIIGSGGGETKGTQRMRRALRDLGWKKHNFEIKKTVDGADRESISHEIDHVKEFEGNPESNKVVALEIEWNNKDPFFDRDLENFKRLHAEGAISVGIVVTRGTTLHEQMRAFVHRYAVERNIVSFEDVARIGLNPTPRKLTAIKKRVERKTKPLEFATAWTDNFVSDKFGEATTHWRKLMDRVSRGVGNPCPLLLVGLPASIVTFEVGERGAV
jgi:hypothetical protein